MEQKSTSQAVQFFCLLWVSFSAISFPSELEIIGLALLQADRELFLIGDVT